MGRFIGYLLGLSIVGIGTAWIVFVLFGWPTLRWTQLGSGLILIAVGLAIFCHLQVTHRKIDAGPVWASTLSITLWVMLPLLFGSYMLQWIYPPWWNTGGHLLPDLVGPKYIIQTLLVLGFPVLPWLSALLWRSLRGWKDRESAHESGHWIVGAIAQHDTSGSRLWVAWFSLIPFLVMLGTVDQLGGIVSPYPLAIWSTLGLVSISLIGIALSKPLSPEDAVIQPVPERQPTTTLPPWPEEMAKRGIALQLLGNCDPTHEQEKTKPQSSTFQGEVSSDRRLIDAVSSLVNSYEHHASIPMRRLIIASDDCGQAESLALTAADLNRRFGTITLVIVAADSSGYARQLGHRTDGVAAITGPDASLPEEAVICVVDAVLLSDRLLVELAQHDQAKRIGLLCWWDLHRFSGVVAANLWAIARRLKRLLDSSGRPDLRVLATIRDHANPGSQRSAFVNRLLPYEFPSETVVHVRRNCQWPVTLYRVDSTNKWIGKLQTHNIDRNLRSSDTLMTTLASVDTTWPTHMSIPPQFNALEASNFDRIRLGQTEIGKRLAHRVDAGAHILEIGNENASSILEVSRCGGRNIPTIRPHHVTLTGGLNPYANWLGEHTARGADGQGSPPPYLLLCPDEAHPSIIRRHLLRALHEREDTLSGLFRHFRWDERAIRETLETLVEKEMLFQEQVRYVDDNSRLIVESLYQNRDLPDTPGPLDTIGDSLIKLYDPEITEGDNALGWLDSERLSILGYPDRVFLRGGIRYRIADWRSYGASSKMRCSREDRLSLTCRIRRPQVRELNLRPGKGQDLLLWQGRAEYIEVVNGYRHWCPSEADVATNTFYERGSIDTRFETDVLVLGFRGEVSGQGITSLAQALRHVLPVHAGIDEDAFEVVPIYNGLPEGSGANIGLTIVDLYPGGIGIISGLGADELFVRGLLAWTVRWLEACSCNEDGACAHCLDSFTAGAIIATAPNSRGEVLRLLRPHVAGEDML